MILKRVGRLGGIKVAHNFKDSLAFSESNSGLAMWEDVYRKAFPTLATITQIKKDGWAQRGGVDKVLTLQSGKTITVDEKIRKQDYGDILLEYWSNEERKVPGWIAKDLACDYIAYAFLPSKTCYLLPFHQLRLAWKNNKDMWVSKYKRVEADNVSYKTISVPVPTAELLNEIKEAMIIKYA